MLWKINLVNFHVYLHIESRKSVAAVDSSVVKSPHRMKLEPVGVFWDIENCPVPLDKSAFALAAKMRRVFFEGKREAEFMCVCDVTKERKEVTDALHKAQVWQYVIHLLVQGLS